VWFLGGFRKGRAPQRASPAQDLRRFAPRHLAIDNLLAEIEATLHGLITSVEGVTSTVLPDFNSIIVAALDGNIQAPTEVFCKLVRAGFYYVSLVFDAVHGGKHNTGHNCRKASELSNLERFSAAVAAD
jgi:hypothetical protein